MVYVSIRALTRRATYRGRRTTAGCGFQFVPSRGGQRGAAVKTASDFEFQFVPSRGGQPRKRRRIEKFLAVSIRALTRRATGMNLYLKFYFPVSIRALTRRATGKAVPRRT